MIGECNKNGDFEQLVADCYDRPVFVFKHSTRCPISASRWLVFQNFAERESRAAFHMVNVIQDGTLSRHIAAETGIGHQSPQAILLYQGEAVWNDSHYSITEEGMRAALDRVLS
jgi:bacillithiol system protein YtxJ